jgi:hypothetical protein
VVPAYYATLGLAWLGAQAVALITQYPLAHLACRQLFAIPFLTVRLGLNLVLFISLFLAEGVVSYFLRKRGEERPVV